MYVHMSVCLFRAYRIGQCRDVTVLRLISLGTVEEVIYLRQVYKQVPDNNDSYNYGGNCYLPAVRSIGMFTNDILTDICI